MLKAFFILFKNIALYLQQFAFVPLSQTWLNFFTSFIICLVLFINFTFFTLRRTRHGVLLY